METFQALLTRKLAEALTAAGLPQAGAVTTATDARFGDYQTNAALVLAKQLGQNPRALAQKIAGHLAVSEWCDPPAIAGAGFINLTLRNATIARQTGELPRRGRVGFPKAGAAKRHGDDLG